MITKVKIIKKKKLKNPVLIAALPGIALVGKIAIDYLVKQLKLELIAEIYSDSFIPSVHTEKGVVSLVRDFIYYSKINNKDFLFLIGPIQPSLDPRFSRHADHYEFARSILIVLKKLNVKTLITLAGIDIGEKRLKLKKPGIVLAANNNVILKKFTVKGIKLSDNGFISGVSGLLIGMALNYKIDGVCIMGETYSKLIGDHSSAKSVLEFLIKKYDFNLDIKEINKAAKKVEESFSLLQEQLSSEEQGFIEEEKKQTYIR